jgi:outer membrane protein assembly factor BamD (BamD/ComL family)
MERSFLKPTQLRTPVLVTALIVFFACAPALFAQRVATPEEILQRGYRAYYEHDWVTATNAYRSVMATPGNATPENYFMLILSQLYAADYANAVVDGENFLIIFPNSEYVSYVRYHIGRAYYLMGNFVNAAYYLTEFCHTYPGHEMYASALFWIAESFFAREQYDEARALYERVVRDFPQDVKRPDAQSRIETIRWFRRAETQINELRNDVAGSKIDLPPRVDYQSLVEPTGLPRPSAPSAKIPDLPQSTPSAAPPASPPPTSPSKDNVLDLQREFVNSLLILSAQLNKDKQMVSDRLQIVTDLIARNTANEPARQWSPEQQRFIADLLARSATQTNGLTTRFESSPVSTDQVERTIAEFLTKNAEFAYQQAPLSERQKFIADLNTLRRRLTDEKSRIEGQQRVLAELITSSMGLSNGVAPSADQRGAIGNNLNTLETQLRSSPSFSPNSASPSSNVVAPESAEYTQLLDKARGLWNVIEERNSATSRGGGGF